MTHYFLRYINILTYLLTGGLHSPRRDSHWCMKIFHGNRRRHPTASCWSYSSPIPSPVTSSSDSPLCSSITPSLFHSRLKTYLFHKSYPVVSLLPPGLPSRTFARTVSSELIGFCFSFSYFLFLCRALDYVGHIVSL